MNPLSSGLENHYKSILYVLFPHFSPATVAYFEVLLGLAVLHQLQQPGVAVQVQEVNLESGVMTHYDITW